MRGSFSEEQGRNPFSSVQQGASAVDEDHTWLFLAAKPKWYIGDNEEFPSRALRIRDVNRKMVDFIIRHFEKPPTILSVRL